MDPYLERSARWSGCHLRLIFCISENLQPRLRPRYVAMVEERVYLEPIDQDRWPDVFVAEQRLPSHLPLRDWRGGGGGGGIAVAEPEVAVAELEWITVPDEREVHEPYIAIYDTEGREVVTIIEVLSPSNKAPGPGRDDYLAKQREILESETNLVEIDLLRAGSHVLAVPVWEVARRGPADYLICTRRTARPGGYEVLRLTVRQPLPLLPIPLRAGEPDVVLDLAAAFTRAYDVGAYDLIVDYTQDPEPPLSRADAAWADALLREQGLRGREDGRGMSGSTT
jgi:hypothetical protein